MKYNYLWILILLVPISYFGQKQHTANTMKKDSAMKVADVSMTSFSFIVGYWQGSGFGEKCEELWMPAVGDQMHGVFRLEDKGKVSFAEFMTISKDEKGFVLKVVHFNPDFSTWEEKNKTTDFRFIKAEKNKLWFNGLTFDLNENSKLIIYLALTEKGKVYEEKFEFTKAGL